MGIEDALRAASHGVRGTEPVSLAGDRLRRATAPSVVAYFIEVVQPAVPMHPALINQAAARGSVARLVASSDVTHDDVRRWIDEFARELRGGLSVGSKNVWFYFWARRAHYAELTKTKVHTDRGSGRWARPLQRGQTR